MNACATTTTASECPGALSEAWRDTDEGDATSDEILAGRHAVSDVSQQAERGGTTTILFLFVWWRRMGCRWSSRTGRTIVTTSSSRCSSRWLTRRARGRDETMLPILNELSRCQARVSDNGSTNSNGVCSARTEDWRVMVARNVRGGRMAQTPKPHAMVADAPELQLQPTSRYTSVRTAKARLGMKGRTARRSTRGE
ncbi:hypothetical protein JG688_00018116 [Phytophthora aleatoria]|uniref:Uncharacterized protein n=1 Tax=Phytophthora aleatoria TaxID=2496075 RepID=A0A8J5IBF2_9STRA|nr:hypothetical protein JG688_00018116 [Phytophthora aleatoria]